MLPVPKVPKNAHIRFVYAGKGLEGFAEHGSANTHHRSGTQTPGRSGQASEALDVSTPEVDAHWGQVRCAKH